MMKLKYESLKYDTLLNMGFTRDDQFSSDKQFFKKYGYKCFWLVKYLIKDQLYVDWHPENGKLELILRKEENIINRRQITTKELSVLCDVFEREGDFPEYEPPMFA